MVKIGRLDDSFLEVFWLQASPVEVNHHSKKKRKGEKGKEKEFKNWKA